MQSPLEAAKKIFAALDKVLELPAVALQTFVKYKNDLPVYQSSDIHEEDMNITQVDRIFRILIIYSAIALALTDIIKPDLHSIVQDILLSLWPAWLVILPTSLP